MPQVTFNTVLTVTVDPDSGSSAISVATTGCLAGDIIVMVVDAIDHGNVTLPSNLAAGEVLGSANEAGGGHTDAQIWIWQWDGISSSYDWGITIPGPATSLAAVACAYSSSDGPGAGSQKYTRYLITSVTNGPLTPTVNDLLVTGQGFAGDATSLGSVSSPFTLRASSVGRQAPSDSRYPQAQIADYGYTAAATSVTWTNTNTTVSSADKWGGTGFVMEGVGTFYYILTLGVPVSTGLHVWQRL